MFVSIAMCALPGNSCVDSRSASGSMLLVRLAELASIANVFAMGLPHRHVSGLSARLVLQHPAMATYPRHLPPRLVSKKGHEIVKDMQFDFELERT